MIKMDSVLSERRKEELTNADAERAFWKLCWGCGQNCCGLIFLPPNLTREGYFKKHPKELPRLKPIEKAAGAPENTK